MKQKADYARHNNKQDIYSCRKEVKMPCGSYFEQVRSSSEKVSSAKTLFSILCTYSCLSTVRELPEVLTT